ncbi:MAG: drug resistance transporter, drug:H+ antiporter family protein [Chlorobi bacterium]|nr:drug resistance transporter, drug:H+ antiporter family protein [Chlorobiota bacterium]
MTPPTPGGAAPATGRAGGWILAATILGSSLSFIDGTVVNVALPALQAGLGASVSQVQWVVEAYALFLGALVLVGGSLGDRYGRRRIFALGIVIFTLASVWCGLSPTIMQLIIARGIQGIGSALLVPGSLAIITASFDEHERGKAIGTWSGFTAITAAIGPLLGGWLIEHASWHWIFFINVPLAAVVLLITFWRVPESHDGDIEGRLDWAGASLVTISLAGLVYGLVESSNLGFGNPRVIAALAVGAIALPAFLYVESHTATPMMPLSLFRSRAFSGTNLLTFLLYAGLGGILFFLPFNLIQVQGYSATQAGAAMLPFIVIMFLLSRWSGGLVAKFGARLPLAVGPAIAAVGGALFALPGIGGSYWSTWFPAMAVLGIGMAISVAPLTTTVMGSVPVHNSGIASGINNAISRIAGLLSVAVLGIVVLAAFNSALDQRLATSGIPPEARKIVEAQRAKAAAAKIPEDVPPELRARLQEIIGTSFVAGFRWAMLISAGLALAGAAGTLIFIDPKKIPEQSPEPEAATF